MPIALCNLVGGNDSLIFDGHSIAVSASGDVLAQAPGFEEALRLGPDTWPRRKSVEEALLRARAKLKSNV